MRHIKFRVWDKEDERWLSSRIHLIGFDGTIWRACATGDEPLDSNRYILIQYTGLRDKNGKEIYEGDIVKSPWGYGNPPKAVELEDIFYWLGECCVDKEHIEVIGNIYENPELLQKEQ